MRMIIATIMVDDDRAIAEDLGTIDYISKEFGCLADSGIFLENARLLDDDDAYDAKAIELLDDLFNL